MTSGEGGAVSTNDETIVEILRKLALHGMSKGASERYSKKYEHWDMEMLGWKYNMTNIQAAMLLGQLENIEKQLERREYICRKYEEGFNNNPEITCLKVVPGSKSARHLFTILVSPEKRDLISKIKRRELGWQSISGQSTFLLITARNLDLPGACSPLQKKLVIAR